MQRHMDQLGYQEQDTILYYHQDIGILLTKRVNRRRQLNRQGVLRQIKVDSDIQVRPDPAKAEPGRPSNGM